MPVSSLGANVRPIQPLIELSSPHPELTVPIPGMRTNCCTRSATRAAPAEIIVLRFSRLPRSASLVYTRGSLRSLLLRAKVPATALITVAGHARDGTCQSTLSVSVIEQHEESSRTEVAGECPEVKIVLNHFGGPLGVGPYRRSEVFPGWRADIKVLSACPNVYVKLGGLAMIVNAFDFHLTPLPPSSGEAGQCLAALRRDLHRGFRRRPLHVREQLPGRQGARAATRCCSTPSSGWRAAPRRRKRPICSPARHRGSTG